MKFDKNSIGVKLWTYFVLFAAVILVLLWLLQTVFLQSFFVSMKKRDVARMADTIAEQYGQADFETTVDRLTFRGAAYVLIADTEGNVFYLSDEHGQGGPKDNQIPQGGDKQPDAFTRLPEDYDEFLQRLLASPGKIISYEQHNDRVEGNLLIYGRMLDDNVVLYISASIEPVNATTQILRTQLVYVTLLSLVLSFVISYFIARKFSEPVAAISQKAGALADGDFDVTFDKGFCTELDDLASTLDHTAKELSKVEALRRELIANISHDLRTPLTMIKAYTEMIRDISGDDKEKRTAHLAIIESEADRLAALVGDILDLSVIQAGGEAPELLNINLSDITWRVVSRFRPMLEHDGYHIKTDIEPDQYVLGNELRLMQVLYNLIANAINYAGEDKSVTVTLTDLGARVRFAVSDCGAGIPLEDISHIWERYYKADNHQRGRAGTGLGLSIVKGILEAHGAQYGVNSAVGEGSEFWFELKK